MAKSKPTNVGCFKISPKNSRKAKISTTNKSLQKIPKQCSSPFRWYFGPAWIRLCNNQPSHINNVYDFLIIRDHRIFFSLGCDSCSSHTTYVHHQCHFWYHCCGWVVDFGRRIFPRIFPTSIGFIISTHLISQYCGWFRCHQTYA